MLSDDIESGAPDRDATDLPSWDPRDEGADLVIGRMTSASADTTHGHSGPNEKVGADEVSEISGAYVATGEPDPILGPSAREVPGITRAPRLDTDRTGATNAP